jgi:epoxyqueuosine reductase
LELYADITQLVTSAGCDFVGVADLTFAHDFIREQGGEVVASFPRAVSIGIALPGAIVDQLVNRGWRENLLNYRHHAYDVINLRLNLIASQVASLIGRAGHRVMPLPAAEGYDRERLRCIFSHKLAAHLAGLGWIGKSCLLVTPQVGPRVRWVSVLTDAPLAPTGTLQEEKCGDCRECVDICPAQAFTGQSFRHEEPREMRYDAHKCQSYFNVLEIKGEPRVCGLCLYVCPYGREI